MEHSPTLEPRPSLTSSLGKHRKLIIAAVVFLAAFAYFGFNAFSNATAYYLTVDEVAALGADFVGEPLQVKGKLVPASFVREDGETLAHFALEENGVQMEAQYDGVLPDLFFSEHSEIVLSGQLGPSGVFQSDRILIKCPSKYQSYDEVPERYFQQPQT